MNKAAAMLSGVRDLLEFQKFNRALEEIWGVIGEANKYVDAMAPWVLRKQDPNRMCTVLYVLAETIRLIGFVIQPFMPKSAEKILDLIAVDPSCRDFKDFDKPLASGTTLPTPEPVFPRFIEDSK